MKSQKGFSAVEAIIILLVVVLLGTPGWYVWKKQHSNDKSASSSSQQKKQTSGQTQQTPDPIADWVTYSNIPGQFSFKHPKAWVFADRPETCTEGLVLFASSSTALGRCASESVGQMMVLSAAGDMQAEYKLSTGYTSITETNVTVSKVNGTKQVATAFHQDGPGSLSDGTKVVQYVFYTNDRTYVAKYTQQPAYPDALHDFDTLVTKTLTFVE